MSFKEFSIDEDVILSEVVWVIMDLHEKLIARGTTKNRYITLVNTPDQNRVLTYASSGWAKQGYKEGKFQLHKEGVESYITREYGVTAEEFLENRAMYLKPVEVMMTMERW
jgi:phage pi2 protein 07